MHVMHGNLNSQGTQMCYMSVALRVVVCILLSIVSMEPTQSLLLPFHVFAALNLEFQECILSCKNVRVTFHKASISCKQGKSP